MNDPRPARRRRRKKILRRSDGSLYDVSERRPISVVELREYVRDGGSPTSDGVNVDRGRLLARTIGGSRSVRATARPTRIGGDAGGQHWRNRTPGEDSSACSRSSSWPGAC